MNLGDDAGTGWLINTLDWGRTWMIALSPYKSALRRTLDAEVAMLAIRDLDLTYDVAVAIDEPCRDSTRSN